VLVRITNMRGIDLRRFDFDFDLTWSAFFLDPDGRVLGRFGGRDAASPDTYLTLNGLKHAMAAHLEGWAFAPKGDPPVKQTADGIDRPEDYPSAKRLKANGCIHCHQVREFQQDLQYERGTWRREMLWVYPLPESLGFRIDPEKQDRVATIQPASPAARAGLTEGSLLREVHGRRLISFADVQYALHCAPSEGRIPIRWFDGQRERQAELELTPGWRETDISWRASMWNVEPAACVYGEDLDVDEKQKLGLKPSRLAFYQGSFVPPTAAKAGIRAGDIIIGADGRDLEMNMLQFNVWVRLNYRVGDTITYDILRDGKPHKIPMKLPRKSY
jgi:serine protease Do